ncbi:MAG: anthranilate phosphoribosyltransferase [Candidatus Omnitrophica bacterium]|nr:anthranilate phosphoribosyltransferase [Candidatus Omnitrophota bacterium]MCB9721332.1 anthranilate phosphoribosyltransferase [Candidatus Omnitrophota bacterium]
MEEVMDTIMSGEAIKEEVASFLLALREKGPTVAEITGAARIMRRFVVGIKSNHTVVLDTCGTGGDKSGTFNISTCTAFVVAGAGVAVAKHGNRSVSGKCGSADILEGLGVKLDIPAERVEQCLNEVGIAFLFAQRHHPAMKNVAAIRKELGVETIFNVLGPLTNPAQATHQMIGVYHRRLVEPMARVLSNLGLRKALVVHGSDGLDEITTTGPTHFCEYNGVDLLSYDISPEEIGLPVASPEELKGGDLDENLRIFRAILDGEQGPRRDIVLLNAAYALYISEKVTSIEDGLRLAAASVDDGKARAKLEALKEFTHAE